MKMVQNASQNNANNGVIKTCNEIVPTFDPENEGQNIIKWLNKINELKVIYEWNELTTIYNATSRLRGLAQSWYQSLSSVNYTWGKWQEKLRRAFPYQENYAYLLEEMLKRNKRKEETIIKYYDDKLILLNQCEIKGSKAVSCIISGIPNENLQAAAKVDNYKYPEELLKFLKTIDEQANTRKPHFQTQKQNTRINQQDVMQRKKCYACGSRDHLISTCHKRPKKCEKCYKYHTGDCIRQVTKYLPKQVMALQEKENNSKKYFVDCKINGVNVKGFIDLGSNCNTIKEETVKLIKLEYKNGIEIIKGYGGGTIESLGVIHNVLLKVDAAEAYTDFIVVPNSCQNIETIIGQPFTEQKHIVIYKDASTLRIIENFSNSLPNFTDLAPLKASFWVKEATVLPPRHMGNLVCKIEGLGEYFIEASVRMKENNEYCILRCIVRTNEKKECSVPVKNPTDKEIVIKPKNIFVRGQKCEKDEIQVDEKEFNFNLEGITVGENITNIQRNLLNDLLTKYKNCFATSFENIGCTTAAELKIELVDDRPVVYKPYRMSPINREKVKEMVNELLQHNIIRESIPLLHHRCY